MAEPEPMRQDNHGGTNFQNNISGGQVNQAQTINIYGSAALPSSEANPFGVPYQRNRFFTGRAAVLKRLHEQLNASGSTAITQIQAISGLGGIGKTQTAVEYTYRHFQDQPTYSHVFWVKADTEVNLNSDFAQLALHAAGEERGEEPSGEKISLASTQQVKFRC